MSKEWNKENTQEYLYLMELREEGLNMFGAIPYLMEGFLLEKEEAQKILSAWMSEFSSFKSDYDNGVM